jgi:L-ribulose-5-phosphate 4-epimerase
MTDYSAYKEKVLEVSQKLSADGYFGTRSGTGGNVSMLVEGEDAIVVTPSGKSYNHMVADDLCVIDFNQKKLEGPHEPSVEAPMHVAVYQNRQDVNAVIHTHQLYASIFAVLNEPIPVLFDEVAVTIGPAVEVAEYGFSGTPELLENVVAKLANRHHCYLLQNHGAMSVGATMEKAYNYVELLEKNAAIYYRALATGKPVSVLPEPLPTALFGIVTGKQDMEIARKEALRQEA